MSAPGSHPLLAARLRRLALVILMGVAATTVQATQPIPAFADVKAAARAKARGKNALVDAFFEYLSDSFRPLLPALLGASLIIAGEAICEAFGLIDTHVPNDQKPTTLLFVDAMFRAVFYFLPVFVAYTSAKKFDTEPVLAMLLGLIFRGVAFEFRFKGRGVARQAWGAAFSIGSIVAAFSQGVILAALVQGLPMEGGHYSGGTWGWLSPFALMTGVALVCGYALLGAGWLILKTEGRLNQVARGWARPLVVCVLAFMGLVSAALPYLDSRVMARWFEGSNFLWLGPVPLLTQFVLSRAG